jgi:hypothetical protein
MSRYLRLKSGRGVLLMELLLPKASNLKLTLAYVALAYLACLAVFEVLPSATWEF